MDGLPELFAGFSRDEVPEPAVYPTSCVPQAWAAATPLLLLRLLLRFDPGASERRLWLAPALPPSIRRLHVAGIHVAGRELTVSVDGDRCDVDGACGLRVTTSPRP